MKSRFILKFEKFSHKKGRTIGDMLFIHYLIFLIVILIAKTSNMSESATRRAIGERNEVESTFGTTKRVYRTNDIRAKLDDTADTWIGACFFAKNAMKFLRGLLCLIFEKAHFVTLKKRISGIIDNLVGFFAKQRDFAIEIN